MPRQNLLELLHRPVVVEIVEVVERGQVQRIVRTVGERFRREALCSGRAAIACSRKQEGYQKTQRRVGDGKRQCFRQGVAEL